MPGSPGCPEVPGGQEFGHYTTQNLKDTVFIMSFAVKISFIISRQNNGLPGRHCLAFQLHPGDDRKYK